MDDMVRASKGLKDGKAPGGDGIPEESIEIRVSQFFQQTALMDHQNMEERPQASKDASIVTIYKQGDRTECGNYRGISLLSTTGKIFARILLNRL